MTQQAEVQFANTPTQAISHIDHVAIVVRRENIQEFVKLLSDALGITFDKVTENPHAGCVAALSWPSGFEIMAPIREEDRLGAYPAVG